MNPVLVEVVRSERVESRHYGAAIATDSDGGVLFSVGETDQPIYPRSAVKALLALPLIETGAADRLGLTDGEIALACSSHSGEPVHVAGVTSMLAKAGREINCLECGAHWPLDDISARTLAGSGRHPSDVHNNCSGKHAGFICIACDRGIDPAGYVEPGHPVMREAVSALAEITGVTLDDSNRGIDGCSIPTHAIPLRALAHGFARFGSGAGLAPARASAASRIRQAVATHPHMVAGTGRFDTRLMSALGARVFSKTGAEGVFCVALPEQGIGIAVKIDDGASRAAEVATASLIERFLPDAPQEAGFAALAQPILRNWNGRITGEIRAVGRLS